MQENYTAYIRQKPIIKHSICIIECKTLSICLCFDPLKREYFLQKQHQHGLSDDRTQYVEVVQATTSKLFWQ